MFLQSQTPEEPQKVGSNQMSQPHHYQRFSIGSELDDKAVRFTFNSYSGQEPKRNTAFLTTLSSLGSLSVQYAPQKEEPIEAGAPKRDVSRFQGFWKHMRPCQASSLVVTDGQNSHRHSVLYSFMIASMSSIWTLQIRRNSQLRICHEPCTTLVRTRNFRTRQRQETKTSPGHHHPPRPRFFQDQ